MGSEEGLLQYERLRRQKSTDRLTPQQTSVLRRVVASRVPVKEGDLVKEGFRKVSLSRTVSTLTKRELITREIDPKNARRRLLRRTDKGAAMLNQMEKLFAVFSTKCSTPIATRGRRRKIRRPPGQMDLLEQPLQDECPQPDTADSKDR
jgi:DNA-binding MarR family transcriptional regulator